MHITVDSSLRRCERLKYFRTHLQVLRERPFILSSEQRATDTSLDNVCVYVRMRRTHCHTRVTASL